MSTTPTLTPLEIRKAEFQRKMRGYDPEEVERFLDLVSEELTQRLGDIARLEHEKRDLRRAVDDSRRREAELQETVLHAQKLSKDITDNARREADVLLREAQVTADNIITQAIEQANKIEGKLNELRTARRDMQLKLRNSLDLFSRILAADMDDERSNAIVRTMPRRPEARTG
ncbi:MAG: DivIVA domain-containing protein [Acidobacteriota bacterium]